MKVVHVIDSLVPGGAEESLVVLAPHLRDLGVDMEVVRLSSRPGLEHRLLQSGTPVHTIDVTTRLRRVTELRRLLRELRPDLVHTSLFEAGLAGRLAARWCRLPVVSSLTATTYGPQHRRELEGRRGRLALAQLANIATARFVTRFHAVSEPVAVTMAGRLRVSPQRIDVVWRGRDRRVLGEPSTARRGATRASLDIAPEALLLLAAARHEPAKGLDVLLEAMAHLLHGMPADDAPVLLMAGGHGTATPGLRDQIEHSGLAPSVRVLGFRDDVADLLCAADAFVLPTRREGLPGAVLEAMAMEVPVVASDLPTVREALTDESLGWLVPPDDPVRLAIALRDALTPSSDRAARVRRARERFDEHFTVEQSAAGLVSLYRRVLDRC